MKKQSLARLLSLVMLLLATWQIAHLQPIKDGLPQLTDKYVITGATIIKAPGQTIENGTILIEDGVIKAVGNNFRIPRGAYKVKADSLYIYAGFIDALSHTGIKEDKKEERPKVKHPGKPPRDVAGIQPERFAQDMVSPSEKSIKDMRGLGYTVSNVVPKGRMLPGAGALMLLSGENTEQMLIKENTGMYAQFRGASGAYPGTIIGVMAKFRELYRNAENADTHQRKFDVGGVSKPSYDASIQSLIPITNRSMSVYWNTPSLLSAHRALALKKELGFNIVLANVKQAWGMEDMIKSQNIPVLLSLDLPEDKSDKKKKDKKDEEDTEEKEEGKNPVAGNVETKDEREALEARRMDSQLKHYQLAASLAKRNVPFAFTSVSAKSKDIHKNIRLMIENGLSEDAALAALTTNPANMLGISKYAGTIEKGKMANLVITKKPYFDEKSQVRYVFINGDMYEYDVKADKKKKEKKDGEATEGSTDIVGVWSYTVEIPGQTQTGTIDISGSEGDYSATLTSDDDDEEIELSDVDYADGTFTFSMEVDGMQLDGEIEIDGTDFEGSITAGQFGSFPITGSKKSPE